MSERIQDSAQAWTEFDRWRRNLRRATILTGVLLSVVMPLAVAGIRAWANDEPFSLESTALVYAFLGPALMVLFWRFGQMGPLRLVTSVRETRLACSSEPDTVGIRDDAGREVQWRVVLPSGATLPRVGTRVWATEPMSRGERIALVVQEPLAAGRHVLEPRDWALLQHR